jgi:hypothetical protein
MTATDPKRTIAVDSLGMRGDTMVIYRPRISPGAIARRGRARHLGQLGATYFRIISVFL